MEDFEITPQGDGEYLIRTPGGNDTDPATFDLDLGDAESVSDGRLADDERTVRATVRYLLEHQEAGDLPERVEIADVDAAYPDAVDRIVALLD